MQEPPPFLNGAESDFDPVDADSLPVCQLRERSQPIDAALLDSKFLHRQCSSNIRRIAHASLPDLDYLLGDHLG